MTQSEHQEHYLQPVAIGLGSNIGDRLALLQYAVSMLHQENILSAIKISSIYETPALLPDGAPKEWDISFLNCVITGNCRLEPEELLNSLKTIEQQIGRQNRGFWAPREIDLDIICWGGLCYTSETLTIPHKQLHKRLFVLAPLSELLPDWAHPHFKENFANCRHYYESLLKSEGSKIHRTDHKITL